MGKSHEIILFATVRHGCEGKNILRNHDSWLRKIFSPLQPWLTVAKRLISWDFPIIFMKISWLLKICIYLWIWQKKSQFHFSFFKVDSQNPKFNLEYLINVSMFWVLCIANSFLCNVHWSRNTLQFTLFTVIAIHYTMLYK